MNILLIAGGWSSEREISFKGATQIEKALTERGHAVTLFDLSENFDKLIDTARKHDVSFINLHGAPGEDGIVQALLDRVDCPYQGSSAAGSFLALHKAASKQLFRHAGLTTPDWVFLPTRPQATQVPWAPPFDYPVFVKSNTGGSSLHLVKAHNAEELHTALEHLFALGEEVLIEPAIQGRDLTCGVLDGVTLPPILILSKGTFFDYHNKYAADGATEICPAPLDDALTRRVQQAALTAHTVLGLSGYSRSDFLLTPDNDLIILETNTIPGMTATSLVPQEAAHVGLPFGALVERLLALALARHQKARDTAQSAHACASVS